MKRNSPDSSSSRPLSFGSFYLKDKGPLWIALWGAGLPGAAMMALTYARMSGMDFLPVANSGPCMGFVALGLAIGYGVYRAAFAITNRRRR